MTRGDTPAKIREKCVQATELMRFSEEIEDDSYCGRPELQVQSNR